MPTNTFRTELIKQHAVLPARVTRVTTAHGELLTPTFMPVGTRAFVNHMTPSDLLAARSQIILGGNTYHMLCAPGLSIIENAGGMHRFMGWNKPMLTDSGGFQVFSLSKKGNLCRIDDNGAQFKHPITHQTIRLSPESSIHTQKVTGADIIMVFDECTPENGGREAAERALERTHRWLNESVNAHLKHPTSVHGDHQALFGIIQGGSFRDLREKSTAAILATPVDGIAIGGEVIGFDMAKTVEIIDWVRPLLPITKSRYTMGVGLRPSDLIDVVARGIDLFDCVAPTRNARHGALYCGKIVPTENQWIRFVGLGEKDSDHLLIKKSIYAKDERPLSENCFCYTCKNFTRSYLHFLFKQKSQLYGHLACIHNISMMQAVCEAMRDCIIPGNTRSLKTGEN